MTYKTMKDTDIINWCAANNQLEWLESKMAEKITAEYYTKKVKVFDEVKGKYVTKADKTSPKVKKSIPITFIQIKRDFCSQFMPELLPTAKIKEPSMRDKLKAAVEAAKK